MNRVFAHTAATCDGILDVPLMNDFFCAVMAEAATTGAQIGSSIDQTAAGRSELTRKLGTFRKSMLKDVEVGKAIEIDGLVSVVHEIEGKLQIAALRTASLPRLTRLFAKSRGLYRV